MGICDAPPWLLSTWVRSCQEAGATADPDAIEDVGITLLKRWGTADRTFHTIRHLADVLCHFDEIAHEAQSPAIVRLAIFYHGAVFHSGRLHKLEGRGGEDEVLGAALAQHDLPSLGVPEAAVARVVALLTCMPGHCPGEKDMDAAALSDADLATLASEPQRYKAYQSGIRAEYADIPVRQFVETRAEILRHLLDRPRLFRTAAAHAWEERARQNLVAELHRTEKELTRLELQDELDDVRLQAAFAAESDKAPAPDAAPSAEAPTTAR